MLFGVTCIWAQRGGGGVKWAKDGKGYYAVESNSGNLLVVHGTGDDNVHYQGTQTLINELVKYDKQFQVMEHCPGGGR